MKSKEELNALKNEVEAVSKKLNELSEGELEQVSGGQAEVFPIPGSEKDFNNQAAANDRTIIILN